MSFQNLPAQLTVLFLGWVFTLYLQSRSNHRAEAIKRKDRIIDKLDELASWSEAQTTKDNFSASKTEEAFSELLLHIELRMNHLNQHIGGNEPTFLTQDLSPLRNINFFQSDLTSIPYEVHSSASHIIEAIEIKSTEVFFSGSILKKIESVIHEIHGVFFGLLSLALLLFLIQHVYIPLMANPT